MKNLIYLIALLFFGTQFLFAENVFSQRAKFSFNKSNVTINELITFIENNSDYVFVFSDNTRQLVDTTMASFNGVFFRDSISITYYGKDSILIKNHDNKYWLENKYYYFNNVFYEE